jgi:hypothetical protein
VESPGRKELAQDQLLQHDLIAKVVPTFADRALDGRFPPPCKPACAEMAPLPGRICEIFMCT